MITNYATCSGIDHNKEIPARQRTDSEAYSMSLLCKQDKEQMDRIEDKLDKLLTNQQNNKGG